MENKIKFFFIKFYWNFVSTCGIIFKDIIFKEANIEIMREFLKILLIDDNSDDRFLTIEELKREFDVDVDQVSTEAEFLQAMIKDNYNIVITDYQLRWATGLEIIRRIKQKFPFLPIIMFTGSQGEEVAVEAMKEGLDDYIIKSENHFMRIPMAIRSILYKIGQDKTRHHTEKVQNVLYNIANAVSTAQDLDELFFEIRKELGTIIDTENFFVALYNQKKDTLSLPFMVDKKDKFKEFPTQKTLTGYVIKHDMPLLVDEKLLNELIAKGEIENVGSPSEIWLGVPLKSKDNIIGALVVQSYTDPHAYTNDDLEMLQFVSNQVAISIERKQSDDALRESEKKYRELADFLPEVVFELNTESRLTYLNKKGFEKFGITQQDLDQGIDIIEYMHPDFKQRAIKEIQDRFNEKEPDSDCEYVIVTKDGKQFPAMIYAELMKTDNQIKGLRCILVDITKLKESEHTLLKAKLKAEESDKLKTAFLSNMSHEIRTPMNAIIGFSSLLTDNGLSSEEKLEYINLINDNGNILLNLINDIIDIAKIETGEMPLSESQCEINQLIDQLSESFQNKRQNQEVEIITRKPNADNNFAIITDPLRLRQVISNLVGNALKFTKKGSVRFGYRIKDDNFMEFFVKDTGIGIPLECQSLIFDRFRQADDSFTRKFGGTGLGLTISKNLINLLGGEIWVDSSPENGSTFYFTIPYKPVNKEVKETVVVNKINKTIYEWHDKLILIAEDVESNYQFLEAVLRKTGCRMLWAKNGVEAVDICSNNSAIDVVLMDIQMPLMNGYEAMRKIKSFRKELPIISQTAYAMLGERELSFEAGCDDYLSKPIRTGELLSTLSKYL